VLDLVQVRMELVVLMIHLSAILKGRHGFSKTRMRAFEGQQSISCFVERRDEVMFLDVVCDWWCNVIAVG
jgi:hypothetical protein